MRVMDYHLIEMSSLFILLTKTIFIHPIQKRILMFKTRQQIADEFGINRKTLERMLKRADMILPSGNVSPKSQQVIYEYFGMPPSMVSQNVSNRGKVGHFN